MTDQTLRYLIEANDRDLKEVQRSVKDLNRSLDSSETSGRAAGRGMESFDRGGSKARRMLGGLAGAGKLAGKVLGLGAAGGLFAIIHTGIGEFQESAKVGAQTNAVIKSTGGIAGVTAKQVDQLSTALMQKSGVDDEAIKSGANMLLTFTNIRNEVGKGNDVFNQATGTLNDMAVALGKEPSKAAVMLGKALNDPIKGITALTRVGVSFTEGQKATIKSMVETGDTAGAQKLILAELNREFGGSAKALGDTLPGQINKSKEAFSNLAGNLVGELAPAFLELLTGVNKHWPEIQKTIEVAVAVIRFALVEILIPAIKIVAEAIGFLAEKARQYWPAIRKAAEDVATWYRQNLQPAIAAVIGFITTLWRIFGDDLKRIATSALNVVKTYFQTVFDIIRGIVKVVTSLITGDWRGALEGLKTIASAVFNGIINMIRALLGLARSVAGLYGTAIKEGVMLYVNAITGAVRGVFSAITGAVRGAVGAVKSAAAAFGGAIYDGITGALSGLGSALGRLITSPINAIIRKINAIHIPGFSLNLPGPLGKIAFAGADPIPNIPELASGGVAMRRTLAFVGERGPEAVVPLDSSRGQRALQQAGGGAAGTTIQIHGMTILEELDVDRQLARIGAAIEARR